MLVRHQTRFVVFAAIVIVFAAVSNHGQQAEHRKLVPVKIGEKWGYANESGTMVIPARFDEAGVFVDGLAPAAVGRDLGQKDVFISSNLNGDQYLKWGFIAENGEFVIAPQFARADNFSEGMAGVAITCRDPLQGYKWGFIDKEGKVIIRPKYYSVDEFVNGHAKVSIGELRAVDWHGSTVSVKFFGKDGYI